MLTQTALCIANSLGSQESCARQGAVSELHALGSFASIRSLVRIHSAVGHGGPVATSHSAIIQRERGGRQTTRHENCCWHIQFYSAGRANLTTLIERGSILGGAR